MKFTLRIEKLRPSALFKELLVMEVVSITKRQDTTRLIKEREMLSEKKIVMTPFFQAPKARNVPICFSLA